MHELYMKEVVPALMKHFSYNNIMQVPKLDKIVINMGLGEAIQNIKILDSATEEIAAITGQRPIITKAKRSIAQFKLRVGMPIGCMVTLRKERMFAFLGRLINVALPRVRDFRGSPPMPLMEEAITPWGSKNRSFSQKSIMTRLIRLKG